MNRKAFTLIELIIVIALMVIMVGVYFLVGNPAKTLAQSRNTERSLQLQTIMNAIRQNVADQSTGQFNCVASGPLPTSTSKIMASGGASGTYDIAPCIIPTYVYALPFDPSATSSHYISATNYDTQYTIIINASGVITLAAPWAELSKTVSVSR